MGICAQEYNKQKNLEKIPQSIPIDDLTIIKNKTKKIICQIKNNSGVKETAFFCAIPFPDKNHQLPVLITNDKIISKEDINNGKTITLSLDDNKLEIEINIDNKRKNYIDKENKISLIEIKRFDGLDINSFFDIDNKILENDQFIQNYYPNQTVYILYYYNNKNVEYSTGIIKCITDNNIIQYNCKSKIDSSGYPILNLNNHGVIGIHQNGNAKYDFAKIIKEPLNKFKEKYKHSINENIMNENIINENIINEKKQNEFVDEISIIYKYKNKNINIDENDPFSLFGKFAADSIDDKQFEKKVGEKMSKNKIFGEKFVKNNKNKCKIFINNKEYELCSYISEEIEKLKENDSLEIKLKGINEITDMSYMFCGCLSLAYLPDIDKLNTNNVTNMRCLFSGCKSLSYLPDIGKWNINNVKDISSLFYGCVLLKFIPDLKKWKTSNITDMSSLFSFCLLLKTIRGIDNWDTHNVTDMSYMFHECFFLDNFPNIGKWSTSKVENMEYMFFGCRSLLFLPDISNWDTRNVTDMTQMFGYCIKISSLPDIEKWNTDKVESMVFMFYKCKLTLNIPSKFKEKSLFDDQEVFSEGMKIIQDLFANEQK